MNWLAASNPCPGLFYGTSAQDGTLIRIRVPGGVLDREQAIAIVELAELWKTSGVQITNRANLQFRAVRSIPTPEIFTALQTIGLAAKNPELDHLRNLMASPTAGIDPTELIDTRSMIQSIDTYIQNTPDLVKLPPKFSIGVDGGGQVGIGTRPISAWQHRYNEIQLSAISHDRFKLTLGGNRQFHETNVSIEVSECIPAIAALAQCYLNYIKQSQSQKPRMRELLTDWGVEKYLDRASFSFDDCSDEISTARSQHLGIQPQKQNELSYIGVALKLGWISIAQLKELIQLSETYSSGELRLTPWQSILLPNVPTGQTSVVLETLSNFELSIHSINAIVACAGKPGCASSKTQTQAHALALMPHLKHPNNIHVTGCTKGCAQPSPAEITLLGTTIQGAEAYSVFVGDRTLTDQPILASELSTIAHLINTVYD